MGSTGHTTTLIISFSGVLSALYHRRISRADLVGALFYFGCTRSHVFNNPVGGDKAEMQYSYYSDPKGVEAVYQIVREAVLAAESEGKVAWRGIHEFPNWVQLNELLASNGLPVIDDSAILEHASIGTGRLYTANAVIEAVKAQKMPYRVIWDR